MYRSQSASGRRSDPAEFEIPNSPEGFAKLPRKAAENRNRTRRRSSSTSEAHDSPFVEAILDAGYTIFLLNPREIEQHRERLRLARTKTDSTDARILADIHRTPYYFPVTTTSSQMVAWPRTPVTHRHSVSAFPTQRSDSTGWDFSTRPRAPQPHLSKLHPCPTAHARAHGDANRVSICQLPSRVATQFGVPNPMPGEPASTKRARVTVRHHKPGAGQPSCNPYHTGCSNATAPTLCDAGHPSYQDPCKQCRSYAPRRTPCPLLSLWRPRYAWRGRRPRCPNRDVRP
ncbi:MAG: transposase [Firmicutes bacterium]|nr:transposase [Bacillota bacterium]